MKYFLLEYLILSILFTANLLSADDTNSSQDYKDAEGYLFIGFEQKEYRPLGTNDLWWVYADSGILSKYSILSAVGDTDKHSIICEASGYLSPERTPGYGHFSAYKREFKIADIKRLSYSKEFILKHYKGHEAIPNSLLTYYIEIATALKLSDKGDIVKLIDPEIIHISDTLRNSDKADYGTDINLNFLRVHFQPQILSARKDPESIYLLRTATTAFWFKNNPKGEWTLEKYLDKPIQ